jgi:hopanoid C-3 methylase
MKVLLVNPPRSPHNAILAHAPAEASRFVHKKLIGPPLGLLTLAAGLRGLHDIEILDMKGEYDLDPGAPPPDVLVRRWVERLQPDIVGVTFIASEYPAGMEILRAVKAVHPAMPTIAGGLHAMLCPEAFDDPAVDVLYMTQSGGGFLQLVEALSCGGSLRDVGGLRVREEGRLVATTAPAPRVDIVDADYPAADRSLLRRWRQTYRVSPEAGLATYVFSSIGCPFRCTFCSIWPQAGGAYLQRDIGAIVRELAGIDDYEVVRFADANTLVDLGFAERLFDRLEAEGIRKSWVMDVRADTAATAPRLIERLARNGLKVVITGFESFRQSELRGYGKSLEAARIAEAVRVYHDNGILVRGNYVIPPDYGEEDFDALAEFAAENRVALSGYTILTPMPGTVLYDRMSSEIVDRDLEKYNFFNCVLRTRLPLERFYQRVGALWAIRQGGLTV